MKRKSKRSLALLLAGALLAGLLPMGTRGESLAAEQPALRNPRILKTTQETAPGSSEKKELKNPTTENGITTWDCIWFGNYWQEDTNGDGKADRNDEKTPIKWRVLSVEGDDVFLLADKNLDYQRYNAMKEDVAWEWETCTMRSWLNGYGAEMNRAGKDYSDNNFLDHAFSADEQTAIKTADVVNNDNPEYGTEGGNDTADKVYLLSVDEVMKTEYGFTSYESTRRAVNTAYTETGGGAGDWWLRSPGVHFDYASYVDSSGFVYTFGSGVDDNFTIAARPALHLNLKAASDAISASSWSYAGTVPSDDLAEWDCIWFGNYWQEDTNGDGGANENDEKTPIKWRVLSVEGDNVFLLADKNLDCQRYNDTEADVTWETCTMRSWLNGYEAEMNRAGKDYSDNNFLDHAFSADEQTAIKTADVVNNDNPEYGTEGGNDTADKVYLLSVDEVMKTEYGFTSFSASNTRQAVNTAYTETGGGRGGWWLRSPGRRSSNASYVGSSGNVSTYGPRVDNIYHAARPALHLNLSSDSSWSYAGTVTSGEGGDDPGMPTPTSSPSPTEPSVTPEVPGKTAGPDNPSVTPSAPRLGSSATPVPGIASDPGKGKAAVGKVSALKLKQKKRTVTASWKKLTGAKGYQICYGTSKKWKNKKQKLVSKNKAVIKDLKKKKTYYFRVRAYRLEEPKKVYGAWGSVKKIRIKK